MVMFYTSIDNFSLELIFLDKSQTEVEKREQYHFHCLQIHLLNCFTLCSAELHVRTKNNNAKNEVANVMECYWAFHNFNSVVLNCYRDYSYI